MHSLRKTLRPLRLNEIFMHKTINTIDSDFTAETIAASLIENKIKEADKILLIRSNGDKRATSKDVDEIRSEYSDSDSAEYLYIHTNRESIYDGLPEGLFHQPASSDKPKTKDDVIAEMRNQREEEALARKFFRPFEMAIDKMKVDIRLYEQQCDKAFEYADLSDIVKEQWPVLALMKPRQAFIFIKAVPLIAEIARDFNLIARMMSMILDCPIHVSEGKQSATQLASQEQIRLKQWRLGINSVLGKRISYDSFDVMIRIGPTSPQQLKGFEANRTNRRILQELINLAIPFDRNVIITYETIETEAKFRLSGKMHKAYLGINTRV